MRVSDVIRGMLNMIDGAQQPQQFVKLTSVVVGGNNLEMDIGAPAAEIAVVEPKETKKGEIV